jgi:hypothetical protein
MQVQQRGCEVRCGGKVGGVPPGHVQVERHATSLQWTARGNVRGYGEGNNPLQAENGATGAFEDACSQTSVKMAPVLDSHCASFASIKDCSSCYQLIPYMKTLFV